MSAYNQDTSHLTRLYKATGYSIKGFKSAFKYEQAFRLECYILLILIPLAIWIGSSPVDYCLLIGSWVFVMVIEMLNSAIEATIDRIGNEQHELSGRAKDIGSAAVMLSVLLATGVWLAILST
jgi:diacylglycerol kinase (ATP)